LLNRRHAGRKYGAVVKMQVGRDMRINLDQRVDQLGQHHVIGLGPRAAIGPQGHRRSGGIGAGHDGQPLFHIEHVEGGHGTVMRRHVVEQLLKGDTGPKSRLSRGVKWASRGAAPMWL
jgi:hypothetical protein